MGKVLFNRFVSIAFLLTLIIGCSGDKQPEERILARVGDKSIAVEEFIRRAEYTVRPPWCDGSDPVEKKIVLNSLIAEKLLAMEAGEENDFITSERVQRQLRGRREQAMRQVQFYEEVYDPAAPDTSEIKAKFRYAGATYDVSYFNAPDSASLKAVQARLAGGGTFEQAFHSLSPAMEPPTRQVSWSMHESASVLDSVYSRPLEVGDVVGPVHDPVNGWLFMRVDDYSIRHALTAEAVQERWKEVEDRLQKRNAETAYAGYIRTIMKGQSIEFHPRVFKRLVNIMGPVYFISDQKKKEMTNRNVWDLNGEALSPDDVRTELERLHSESLFTVDGRVWTVKAFLTELDAHPLVFRNKRMEKSEFGRELQLAIADLVRDCALTEAAYQKGYDRNPAVIREEAMWKDYLNYLSYKHQYLKSMHADSLGEIDMTEAVDLYLNAYVDSLQAKYSDRVEIDIDALDKIQLTRIPMSVNWTGAPFVKAVPSFPLVTTDVRLNYGRKMNP